MIHMTAILSTSAFLKEGLLADIEASRCPWQAFFSISPRQMREFFCNCKINVVRDMGTS